MLVSDLILSLVIHALLALIAAHSLANGTSSLREFASSNQQCSGHRLTNPRTYYIAVVLGVASWIYSARTLRHASTGQRRIFDTDRRRIFDTGRRSRRIFDEITRPIRYLRGGPGGPGLGPLFRLFPRWIDSSSEIVPPQMDTVTFCEEYHLSDDILDRLLKKGCHSTDSLFDASLGGVDLTDGQAAEVRWALRQMLLGKVSSSEAIEKLSSQVPSTEEGLTVFRVFGGCGGPGGKGQHNGGYGGDGKAPQGEHVLWFEALIGSQDTRPGDQRKIFVWHIYGGTGGDGGHGDIGGDGGIGEGPRLSTHLVPLDDKIRRRDQGFETVGGLFEAFDMDFPQPHFQLGHICTVKAALEFFKDALMQTRYGEENRLGHSLNLHKSMQTRGDENRPGHSLILYKSPIGEGAERPRPLIPANKGFYIPINESAASVAVIGKLSRGHHRAELNWILGGQPAPVTGYSLSLPSTLSTDHHPTVSNDLNSLGIPLELPLGPSHDRTLLTTRLETEITTQMTATEAQIEAPPSVEARDRQPEVHLHQQLNVSGATTITVNALPLSPSDSMLATDVVTKTTAHFSSTETHIDPPGRDDRPPAGYRHRLCQHTSTYCA
ncbi:hypothetical protein MSAN_02144800 [Mycena sanguinolenta]|uniref:Uncharacterized protein n=1 Tax=Mycena sanguinolenta TaxID=230812 RepID=A0A8H7CKG9_9AGAR|nr:hypothetical protein MSAN_02144800 [Mycena sanguinolenta]